MALEAEFDSEISSNPRREKRRQEDKRRMAYRRAIEDYRESQALHALVADFPELSGFLGQDRR